MRAYSTNFGSSLSWVPFCSPLASVYGYMLNLAILAQ